MKKSPLSTPGGSRGFHQGRNQNRGFGYYQRKNDNRNFYPSYGSNNSFSGVAENDMIPLDSSSPIKSSNWRLPNNKNNQYYYDRKSSGYHNNQRNSYGNNLGSPYSHKGNQQNQRRDAHYYRSLPITEIIDVKSIFSDPWAQLNDSNASAKTSPTVVNNSVEIIFEKNKDLSSESISENSTINISSSYDEITEGSSVDLHMDKINFSQESKNSTALSNATKEQSLDNIDLSKSKSLIETENECT